MEFRLTMIGAGPYYAFPSNLADFSTWEAARIASTGSSGNWLFDIPLTGADHYHVFEGSTAPTSWGEWVAFIDLTDAKKLDTANNLLVGGLVTSSSPVVGTATISPLVIGDDYYGDRAIVFYIEPPDEDPGDCTTIFGISGSNVTGEISEVTVDSEDKWALTFELSRAYTAALIQGMNRYSVEVRKPNEGGTAYVTQQRGTVKMVAKSVSNS